MEFDAKSTGFAAMVIKVVRRTTSISEAINELNKKGFRTKYKANVYRSIILKVLAVHEIDYISIQSANRIQMLLKLKQEKIDKQHQYNEILKIMVKMYEDGSKVIDIKKALNDLGATTKFGCIWTVPRCFIAIRSNHIVINHNDELKHRYELKVLERIKSVQESNKWQISQDELVTLLNTEGFTRPKSVALLHGKKITKNYLSNLMRLKNRC